MYQGVSILRVAMWGQALAWFSLFFFGESNLTKLENFSESALPTAMTFFIIILTSLYVAAILVNFAAAHLRSKNMMTVSLFLTPIIVILMLVFGEQYFTLTGNASTTMKILYYVSVGLGAVFPMLVLLFKWKEFEFKNKKTYLGLLYFLPLLLLVFPLQLPILLFGNGELRITTFSIPQFIWIGLLVVTLFLVAGILNKYDKRTCFNALAIISLALLFQYFRYYTFRSFSHANLPLHLCNIGLVLIFLSFLIKSRQLFVFTHFFNILGAVIAIVFPLSASGYILQYPTLEFIFCHSFLVLIPIWAVMLGVQKKPTRKELLKITPYFFGIYWIIVGISSWLVLSDHNVNYFYSINSMIADIIPVLAPLREVTFMIGSATFYPLYQLALCFGIIAIAFLCSYLFDHIYKIEDAKALIRKIRYEDAKKKKEILPVEIAKTAQYNVEVVDLHKTYKNGHKALHGVNLSVKKGEIVGVLGHNGAGKSTLIKCLTSILDFKEGQILFDGCDIQTSPQLAKKNMGYVPDNHATYDNLTGIEYLNYVADMHGLGECRHVRIAELLRIFNLEFAATKQINGYSHGMRQKISLISAILHKPKVLILDEPVAGLDFPTAQEVKKFLRKYCKANNSVILTSHLMDMVSEICDRVVVISEGRMVQEEGDK